MSDNPQQTKQEPQQPASPPLLKAYLKKTKRESNQKKRGVPKQQQQASLLAKQNTSTKRPKQKQLQLLQFMGNKKQSNHVETTSSEEYINSDRASLEQDLRKKDEAIKTLQMEHRNQQQKTAKLKEQHVLFCRKTRQAILRSKIELAAIQRRQKGEINSRFGYFRDSSCKQFVQGGYLLQFKDKISNIQKSITQLQGKKSESSPEGKTIIQSQLQFMRKKLFQCRQQLSIREKEVNNYKEQLRLYFKGQESIFAKDNWPLLKNRYQPLHFIGSGGFGEVYSGFDVETYQDIAIKIHDLDKTSAEIYEPLMKHLNRQIKIHKQLKHPNIVRMIDQLELQGNRIGIVMEYCSGPQLRSYLKKQVCLDEVQAKQIIKQVIFAVKYLHDQKYTVIHYDLKPANILFHNGIIKIVDFGISKVIQGEDSRIDLTSPKAGTFYYLPPEVYQEYDAKISSKVDVWSIGVIFYEMLYGRRPFGHGVSQDKLIHSREILKGNQIDFPNSSPKNYRISNEAKEFIRQCLERNPQNRLSSQEAYDHLYIN